jgi:hypothetical protein
MLIATTAYADRVPVAVLWMGDPATLDEGGRVVDATNNALARSPTARPLDSVADKKALLEGGPVARAAALQASAEASYGKLKPADAIKDAEAAEQILLSEVPMLEAQRRLAATERLLLAAYDQLGRAEDAARAAERLTWTAGTHDDVKPLLDKHLRSRAFQPPFQPVKVVSEPAGADVYRNLYPAGQAPADVAGGDPALDVLDVELPGYKRGHQPLDRTGGETKITLVKEDRIGALVDAVRAKAPDAPAPEVAAVGKRVGAQRLLVLMPDGQGKVLARWLDVKQAKWGANVLRTDGMQSGALAGYVAPAAPAVPTTAIAAKAPETKKSKWGAWGKWYTWVAAGAVVLLVGGLLIAEHVGSDSLHISAKTAATGQ